MIGVYMRNTIKYRLLSLILCFSLLAGNVMYAHATETGESESTSGGSSSSDIRDDIDEVDDELDKVGGEIGDLEGNLGNAQDDHSNALQNKTEVEAYLDQLNRQYQTLASRLDKVEKDITAKKKEIADQEAAITAKQIEIDEKTAEITTVEASIQKTREKIAETENDLADQYEAMKKRIQLMYENSSGTQYLEILLESGSLTAFLKQAEYIESMMDYDSEMRDKYQKTKEDLDHTRASLEADQAKLVSDREILEADHQELEEKNVSLKKTKEELDVLQKSLKKQQANVAGQQATSAKELQEYVDQMTSSSDAIHSYEEKIAAKKKYYDELLARKKWLEEEEARKKAEEEAENTGGGNITEGDSGIDNSITVDVSEEELTLLSAIIYCESGNQSYEGQLAVGYVIMNRVRSNKFPNTITEVVYQKNQFSPVGSGRLAVILAMEADPDVPGKVTDSCRRAAREVLTGTSNVGESLFFRTHKPVPQLEENLKANGIPYYIIGAHIFYHRWVAY